MNIFPRIKIILPARLRTGLMLVVAPIDQWIFVNGIFGSAQGWEELAAELVNSGAYGPGKQGTSFFTFTGLLRLFEQEHAIALAQVIRDRWKAANGGRVCLVCHSDGCPTARKAMQILAQTDPLIEVELFLIAAADLRDFGPSGNGLNALIASGSVKRVLLGVSTGDMILGFNWLTPSFWGCTLGRDGPTGQANPVLMIDFASLPNMTALGATLIQAEDDSKGHIAWMYLNGGNQLNTATIDACLAMSPPAAMTGGTA